MASPSRYKGVCQTCGDRGTVNLLISCEQCNDSFVHHYCLDNINLHDDNIDWKCEDCVPKASKTSPIRKSERITLKRDRAIKVRVNWRERLCKNGSISRRRTAVKGENQEPRKERRKVGLENEVTLGDNCIGDNVPLSPSSNVSLKMKNCLPPLGPENQFFSSAPNDEKKNQLLNNDNLVSQERRTKRRRLLLEDEADLEEEPKSSPLLEPDNHFISSAPPEEKKKQLLNDDTLGSQESRKKRRRLVLEEDEADLEENSAKASICLSSSSNVSLNKPEYLSSLAPGGKVDAHPRRDHVWRGCFGISVGRNIINIGLLAHLSCEACHKVCEAATMLPPVPNIEVFRRMEVWPKSFQYTPPTGYHIALYFFPESRRDEKNYDSVVDDVIDHDLALKAQMDDIELLVFSSRVLPQHHWRFRTKYYLWGVFKPRQFPESPGTSTSPVIGTIRAECVNSSLKDLPVTATKSWSCPLKDLPKVATKAPSTCSASSHVYPPPPSSFLFTSTNSSPEAIYRSDRAEQPRDKVQDEVQSSQVHEERDEEGRPVGNGVISTKSKAKSEYFAEIENHIHFRAHLRLKDRIGAGRSRKGPGMNFSGKNCRNRDASGSSGTSSSSGSRR